MAIPIMTKNKTITVIESVFIYIFVRLYSKYTLSQKSGKPMENRLTDIKNESFEKLGDGPGFFKVVGR
jgi:hypothetical protein